MAFFVGRTLRRRGDLFEYLAPSQCEARLEGISKDFNWLGHTHVQGVRTFGTRTVVNPGSMGLPRDGAGEACYALYDSGGVIPKRVAYDISLTISAFYGAPLPGHVITGLQAVLLSSRCG